MTTDAWTCILIFLLKSKHWSEFWLKDLWWGLGPSVLLVIPCRAWHFDTGSVKMRVVSDYSDVNIVRVDVEERNKEQQHSEWEHTASVLCLSSLLEHSVKCHLCPGVYGLRYNCPVLLLHFAMHVNWIYEVLANKILFVSEVNVFHMIILLLQKIHGLEVGRKSVFDFA